MSQKAVDVPDTDMRRRAAWLLAMLVIAAILIVTVMTTVLNTDDGSGSGGGKALGPGAITSTGPPTPAATDHQLSSTAPTGGTSGTPSTSATTSTTPAGPVTCPTQAPCMLGGDVGNAVAAIDAFRTAHGKPIVPVAVSPAAQACALSRGNGGCTGGWAETEIPAPADGTAAVLKIQQFAKLLDPQTKSIQIGWAYDPASKTYYFATIRQG